MRSRSNSALLLAALALGACATAPARPAGPIPVEIDQRVRVTLSSRAAVGPLQGTVVLVAADTLTVEREEGGVRQLTRNRIDHIEVSITRIRDPFSAAGNGILAGAPLLVPLILLAPIIASEADASVIPFILAPVAALAAIGAIMGGGPQDVWVEAFWPEAGAQPEPPDSLDAGGR